MHVLHDAFHDHGLRRRLFYCLLFSLLVIVLFSDASLASAGTGRIKLADVGESIFDSFSEYALYAGAAVFSCGAIPMLAGRDMGGLGTALIVVGAGVASIRYVPDVLSLIKAHGGLV